MPRRPLIEQLWHRDRAPILWPVWAALTPLSGLYRAALSLRSCLLSRSERAPLPVISIGNLTVGGNAKTPFALYLARLLQAHGYKIGIVSRGYGRSQNTPRLVADGGELLVDAVQGGDEPAMMAHRFEGPIAVASRRIEAIRMLAQRQSLDVIILDDGFQHRELYRDLDLIVVSSRSGFGNGWLLPAGPLREPLAALSRADAVIIVTSNDESDALSSGERQSISHRPVLRASVKPTALVQASAAGWFEHPLALRGRTIVAVSGLANPAGFIAMIAGLGALIVSSLAFPDHHQYSPEDWDEIRVAAKGTDLVITTEKDLVKLQAFSPTIPSLYALRVELTMDEEGEGQLLEMARDAIRNSRDRTSLD